jgi:hypothetical protein
MVLESQDYQIWSYIMGKYILSDPRGLLRGGFRDTEI